MATRDCDVKITCECSEVPWANLSAEIAEPYVFVSPHIIIVPPPLGRMFTQLGCKRWCYSAISQADADACAIAQATECATVPDGPEPPIVVDPPLPPTGYPQVSVFATDPSTSFGDDPGIFTLSRNGSLAQPLAVQFTLSGEAQNGVDYDTLPYTVTMSAGDNEVDVIVIPMDTGEIVSKTVILTILAGSNYSPGASSSDTVEIAAVFCGTPSFKVFGYGPEIAAEIAALLPDSEDSDLPEWDGILRLPIGGNYYGSLSGCYSISGKRIEFSISTNRSVLDTTGCPSGWIEALPGDPGCFACFFGSTTNTHITSDMLTINDEFNNRIEFVSQASGVVGDYQLLTYALCDDSFLGNTAYKVGEDDVARTTYGAVLLSVVDL